MIARTDLVNFLSGLSSSAGFLDNIKIKYRPWICPFDRLLSYAENKSSVFDIGCGSGQFCALVHHFTHVEKTKGIEIHKDLIENARQINHTEENSQLEFEVFDGKNIPNDIINYDLVYMIDVLHHIPKESQIDFMQEVYHKMAKGATLVLKDIDAGHPFVIFNKIHDLLLAGEIGHEISTKKMIPILEKIGFHISEQYNIRTLVYPHSFFICTK